MSTVKGDLTEGGFGLANKVRVTAKAVGGPRGKLRLLNSTLCFTVIRQTQKS